MVNKDCSRRADPDIAEDFNYADKDICVLADIAIPDSDDEDIDIQPESRWPSKNNIVRYISTVIETSGDFNLSRSRAFVG